MLTLRERNDVFRVIEDNGIDPRDIEFVDGNVDTRILHRPTGSTFSFALHHVYDYYFEVTDGPETDQFGKEAETWGRLLNAIAIWVSEVQYVAGTPDFWEELQSSREAITAVEAAEADNTPFSSAEQEQIAAAFDAAKLVARERYELRDDQLASIEQKLDELVEASRTWGRKDWITLVGSTGFSLIVSSLIPPSVVQHVLGQALTGIAQLFGIHIPALPQA